MNASGGEHVHLYCDDAGRLDADRRCAGCGYNLRGLAPTGTCPECGTLVADALDEDELLCADPRWLDATIRGCLLMAIGIGALAVVCFVAAFGSHLVDLSAFWICACAGAAMLFVGVGNWVLTTSRADTLPVDSRIEWWARFISRWIGVLLFGFTALQFITQQFPGVFTTYWPGIQFMMGMLFVNVHAMHLRALAVQVGQQWLIDCTTMFHVLAFGIVGSFTLVQILMMPQYVFEIACCAQGLMLIVALYWVPLLLRLCDELRLARQIIRNRPAGMT